MKPGVSRSRELSVAEVAGELLATQYRNICANETAAIRGRGSEPLHNLRTAVRRFCAVLRFFRKPMAGTSAASLERALIRMNRRLGGARDMDVWVDFLLSKDVQEEMAGNSRWKSFLRHQIERKRQENANARRILRSRNYSWLHDRMRRFLSDELLKAADGSKPGDLKRFIARKVRKAFVRSLKTAGKRARLSPEKAHQVRRRIRRARYWAEFFEPMIGPVSQKLSRRLKQTADELGWVHDLDLQLGRFCQAKPHAPPRLIRELRRGRQAHLKASIRSLRRLRKPRFRRRFLRALKPRSRR